MSLAPHGTNCGESMAWAGFVLIRFYASINPFSTNRSIWEHFTCIKAWSHGPVSLKSRKVRPRIV